MDEPGEGNACHEYSVRQIGDTDGIVESFARVKFQKGPVKENGINGCHQEDLIAIVIDRLQSFQEGQFSCRENALALTKLQEALHWLNHRTQSRIDRGIEGTNQK
jgi:hypothetical protein